MCERPHREKNLENRKKKTLTARSFTQPAFPAVLREHSLGVPQIFSPRSRFLHNFNCAITLFSARSLNSLFRYFHVQNYELVEKKLR